MGNKKNLTVYEINYIEYFGEHERYNSVYVVAVDDYEAVEYARHLAKTFYTDWSDYENDEDVRDKGEDEAEEPEEWQAYHPRGDCRVKFTSIWANPYIYIEAVDSYDDVCLVPLVENAVSYDVAFKAKRPVEMG